MENIFYLIKIINKKKKKNQIKSDYFQFLLTAKIASFG